MFAAIVNILTRWLTHKVSPLHNMLCDFERIRQEIKPGDVVLVEGRSRVSEVIKLITQSPWSHAVLYIGRLHDIEDLALRDAIKQHYFGSLDQQLIIESELGTGTVIRALSDYGEEHLRICRPRGIAFGDSQAVIAYAIGRVGSAYDVRQIFDLARFLFPWFMLPRRWRSSLFTANPGETTRTVCSTMIAEAFGSIQFPILPLVKREEGGEVRLFMRNPKLCTPRDFDYSPYFEIIKYPFMDVHSYSEHRLLPWTGSGELTKEERQMYVSASMEPLRE
jgi:hypothetical protein